MKVNGGLAAAVLVALLGCSTASTSPAARTAAGSSPAAASQLTVLELRPQPGATLTEDATIEARLEYRVPDDASSATYSIVPMFADRRGRGYTFTATAPSDSQTLAPGAGHVDIRYPIRKEWNDARLARPVELFFAIVRTEGSKSRVVAKSTSFTFQ